MFWSRKLPSDESSTEQYVLDCDPVDFKLGLSALHIKHRVEQFYDGGEANAAEGPQEILQDAAMLRATFEDAGFAVPDYKTKDAELLLAETVRYFSGVGTLLRDGHAGDAKELAITISENSN